MRFHRLMCFLLRRVHLNLIDLQAKKSTKSFALLACHRLLLFTYKLCGFRSRKWDNGRVLSEVDVNLVAICLGDIRFLVTIWPLGSLLSNSCFTPLFPHLLSVELFTFYWNGINRSHTTFKHHLSLDTPVLPGTQDKPGKLALLSPNVCAPQLLLRPGAIRTERRCRSCVQWRPKVWGVRRECVQYFTDAF
jgi:hypothetical protein